jgi:hypothetical protein
MKRVCKITQLATSLAAIANVARVAQLVEQRTENPRVGGSSPPPGTTFS